MSRPRPGWGTRRAWRPMRLRGRNAVVTGAAGGIGRAIALALARRGCELALADIDEHGLAATASMASSMGVRVSTHGLDVADAEQVAAFPRRVAAGHDSVDLLVNNAGVALVGSFEEIEPADFDWLVSINFSGVVRMTRAFLPLLRSSDDARLVNISSVFGLIATPRNSAYAASKFAVRGFSESLRHELAGSSVGVTVVHPGGVATGIADRARSPKDMDAADVERWRRRGRKALVMPPEAAGEIIVRGVERRQPRVLVGNDARVLSVVERIAPVSHMRLLGLLRPQRDAKSATAAAS